MKLYYIANARMPHKKAYAIQIAKMCEAFIEEGVDLELIIPRQKGMVEDIKDYYKLRPSLRVTRLPSFDLYARGRWGYFLSGVSFTISYFAYMLLKRCQGKRGIIYTIDMDTFSFVVSTFLGMPCFLETHGGKAKSRINKIFFKHVNGVIVINTIIKQQIAKVMSFPENKMLIWPNGIDLELFHSIPKNDARRSLSLPQEAKIVMYCGRFYGWKGLDVLIDAAKELPQNIFVYIVGGTKDEFLSVAKRNELPFNMVFVGGKSYTEVPVWLSAADTLLVLGTKHDTQSYYYTSPMKVFEYLAMGRTIVASRTPAIQDIVSDEEVVFYEPDNPKDLAQKMELAVSSSEAMDKKIAAAVIKAKDFTWEKRAKDILEFIKKNI